MGTNFKYIAAIGLHLFIGILIYLNESLAKAYFFGALFYFLFRIFQVPNHLKTFEILKAAAYFVGAEILLRMTKGAFSYEAGKYVLIFLMVLGIFYKGVSGKSYPYFISLLLLIPSIVVASITLSYDVNFRTNIIFVLSGPVSLGIAAFFCYQKKIHINQLHKVLLYMVLPIIANTAYIFIYNPSVRDVLSGNGSNRAASGGWGANQVATVLGLGMFVMVVRLFAKSPNLFLKIVNIVLFSAISFRAIVTFSRGGVITAAIAIIVFLLFYFVKVSTKRKLQLVKMSVVFVVAILGIWAISSNQTDGYIDLRYNNKDHLGRQKEDPSTGRKQLFNNEIDGFLAHPFLGIGASRAKDLRIENGGQAIASHSEISRLLAEHGMLGVIILIILIFKPIHFRLTNKNNYFFYAFLCFWFFTINHSSMRIAAPAFIYALALLNVTYEKNPIHRKQLKSKKQ